MATGTTPGMYELGRELSRSQLLEEFGAMPRRLAAALDGVSSDGLVARPRTDAWSAFQTLCHMRDAALVYSARFRWIVFDDVPFLPNYDEDRWVGDSQDLAADVPAILAEVAASRSDLIRVLSRMPDSAWDREGRHEILDLVRLEPYVRHQLRHEEMHFEQLALALTGR